MNLNGIMVSKINQREKGKHCMISVRGGIKKSQINENIEKEIRLVEAEGGC